MDLSSYEFIQNPYKTYQYLLKSSPVHHNPQNDFYYVSDYELVQKLFTHKDASSNRVKMMTRGMPGEMLQKIKPLTDNFSKWLIFNDPPFHTPLRKVINSSLTVNLVSALMDSINQLAEDLLASVGKSFDLISDFAYPLPILVISNMLSVPSEDRFEIKRWSDDIVRFLGERTTPAQIIQIQQSIIEAENYFQSHLRSQRENPTSLLMQKMIDFQKGEPDFTDEHLIANIIALLFAGHETTTNAIGNSIFTLLTQLKTVPNNNYLLSSIDLLLNECLRFESPVQRMGRYTTSAIEVGDTVIPEDKRILLLIGAANRDPKIFNQPNKFIFGL